MGKSSEAQKRLRHCGAARQHQPAQTKTRGRHQLAAIDYK
jgi:hypothetical protein